MKWSKIKNLWSRRQYCMYIVFNIITSKSKLKQPLLDFQEAFIRTKWGKLNVRNAPRVHTFRRWIILENVQQTAVHARMVRPSVHVHSIYMHHYIFLGITLLAQNCEGLFLFFPWFCAWIDELKMSSKLGKGNKDVLSVILQECTCYRIQGLKWNSTFI